MLYSSKTISDWKPGKGPGDITTYERRQTPLESYRERGVRYCKLFSTTLNMKYKRKMMGWVHLEIIEDHKLFWNYVYNNNARKQFIIQYGD